MSDLVSRERALELSEGLSATASHIAKVAKVVGDADARWAFTQWALRKRAAAKFTDAERMLFTREALEQASHEVVARYHASRFPQGELVADLSCGIGGDLIALALRGPVVGYEIDEERACYAEHNLRTFGLDGVVLRQDCLSAHWDFEYAFCDPSRRVDGQRVGMEEYEPDVFRTAERMQSLKLGCIKLSPMTEDSILEQLGEAVEFVSFDRECKEALVWFGSEVWSGRFAVMAETGERLEATEGKYQRVEKPLSYLFEADAAAIRAHCLPAICERTGAFALGDSNGYLTADVSIESPWLRGFRVMSAGRFDRARVLHAIRATGVCVQDVKSRGVKHQHHAKQFRVHGEPGWLMLYPVGKSIHFALVDTA